MSNCQRKVRKIKKAIKNLVVVSKSESSMENN